MNVVGLGTADKMRIAGALYRAVSAVRAIGGARSDIVICRRGGLRWRLDLSEGIDLSIYLFGRFERPVERLVDRYLASGMIALDIGANVGSHALPMAAKAAPSGRVFAVEPTQWAYRRLCVNRRLNPRLADVLVPVRAAVGGTEAQAGEYYASWNVKQQGDVHGVHRGALRSAQGARRVALDALVGDLKLTRVDFIKLDVDGHECEVLSRGHDTLSRLRPIVLFEFSPYALEERGCSAGQLLGIFQEHGYSFRDAAGRTIDDAGSLASRTPRFGSINLVAVP